ncbi:MAG: IclR family transcriptional regulator [Peptococcaceae bacterium]|nr:IclR family transcriptional regulator [Peptococcaceae bacterium]
MNDKDQKSAVPSVEYAIKILDFLSRFKNRKSSLAEISRALAISKSTCLRILRVLRHYGLVYYDEETRKYSLGEYLVVLGSRAADFSDRLAVCRPHLAALCRKTGLTCVLVGPAPQNRLMYVAKEEPDVDVRINVTVGQYFPITGASFGKCFLAFMDEEEAGRVISEAGIKQFTSRTITNLDEFKKNLQAVRRLGYAYSFEEHTQGVSALAAPVFDSGGKVVLVAACLGTPALLNESNMQGIRDAVLDAAGRMTRDLGGVSG